jgi:hypothetical protein
MKQKFYTTSNKIIELVWAVGDRPKLQNQVEKNDCPDKLLMFIKVYQ